MNKKNDRNLKTGVELINSFFEKLNTDKQEYPSPEIVSIIVELYNKGKLSRTNISNSLDELREKNEKK